MKNVSASWTAETVRERWSGGGACWGEKEVGQRVCLLQSWHASCIAVQLINKSKDYHVFTIWHVCLNHSALLSVYPTTWLLYSSLVFPLCLLLCPSQLCFLPQRGQSGRLMCSQDWSALSEAPLLLPFAYTASIRQAVINLAQSTLLGPPRRHSPWSPCSPDMSRGWWVSPSWTD